MKKIFRTMFFAVAIIFCFSANVQAKDIWIASKGDNLHYYIVAETFNRTVADNFSVVVKVVHRQDNVSVNRTWDAHTNEFELYPDKQWYFSNEQPPIWYPVANDWIAQRICNYFVGHIE